MGQADIHAAVGQAGHQAQPPPTHRQLSRQHSHLLIQGIGAKYTIYIHTYMALLCTLNCLSPIGSV